MLVELLENRLHSFFELRVTAFAPDFRIHLDFDVRGDAFIFNAPMSFGSEKGKTWRGYTPPPMKRGISGNADFPAPRTFTNQRPQSHVMKKPRNKSPPEPAYWLISMAFAPKIA